MLANLSRNLAIGVKWVLRHSQPAGRPDGSWTHGLSGAVEQATPVAAGYSHFEVCFQAFHKDRIAVDVLTPTSLRFTTAGGVRDVRSAHIRKVTVRAKGNSRCNVPLHGRRVRRFTMPLSAWFGDAFIPAHGVFHTASRGSCGARPCRNIASV